VSNTYLHHVPGRLRLRTPRVKHDEAEARRARAYVEVVEGVEAVDVNTLTGSITVKYDAGRLSAEALLHVLCQGGYCDPTAASRNDGYLQLAATRAGHVVGKMVFGMVVEKAVERSARALIAAIL
jgi:copper chaperone CopZ